MQAQGIEWVEHYRHAAGAALKDVLEGRLAAGIDRHLEDMAAHAVPTGATAATGVAPGLNPAVGEIELGVPRTRTYSALDVVRADARRAAERRVLGRGAYLVASGVGGARDDNRRSDPGQHDESHVRHSVGAFHEDVRGGAEQANDRQASPFDSRPILSRRSRSALSLMKPSASRWS